MNTLGANVGTLPSNIARGLSTDPDDPSVDAVAFDAAGKLGMGDIDLSDDGRTLYFTNLNERNVYALNIGNPATTPTSATRYDLPATACVNGVARPWGLKIRDGVLYAGVICTGENELYVTGQITRTNTNLRGLAACRRGVVREWNLAQRVNFCARWGNKASERRQETRLGEFEGQQSVQTFEVVSQTHPRPFISNRN